MLCSINLPSSSFLGHVTGLLFCLNVKTLASSVYAFLVCYVFDQKTPEKSVNRKGLVVLDIECFENNIVKKLGNFKDGQTVGYSFLPPKIPNQHPNLLACPKFSI